jgi:hypothetical protein
MPRDQALWDSGVLENIATVGDEQIVEWGFSDPVLVRKTAFQNPGTQWYLFGETNRRGYMHGNRFAPVFKYFVDQIKLADDTAQIMSPSILNWDFTCIGCGFLVDCEGLSLSGYQCGKVWLKTFINSYEIRYGVKPPVDIWAIDVYPLDWVSIPNSAVHADIVIDQLEKLRGYLDTIPEYQNTPIWITEIAVHVGYDRWLVDEETGLVGPDLGPGLYYHADKMADYLITILDWLESNADDYIIEKWFFFVTWKDLVNVPADDPYMGITFFEDRETGSQLNCLGRIYNAYSIYGSAQGNTCSTPPHTH